MYGKKKLFSITLGCDWFVKHGTQLHTTTLLSTPHISTHVIHTEIHIEPSQLRLADLQHLFGQFPSIFRKTQRKLTLL